MKTLQNLFEMKNAAYDRLYLVEQKISTFCSTDSMQDSVAAWEQEGRFLRSEIRRLNEEIAAKNAQFFVT